MTNRDGIADGEAVVERTVAVSDDEFGPGRTAAYALGSIAHGGFAPLVSDVDVMLVLDRVDATTAARVASVRERVRREVPGDLSDRLSVFWSDPAGVRTGVGEHHRLPEVDRLDLLESGWLLAGDDVRAGATRPRTADLVRQAAEFALAKFDDAYLARLRDPDALMDGGPRPVTKAILFPVRFLYTEDTGRIGRNDEAAAWYPTRHPHGELVVAAAAWRTAAPPDTAAARELLAHHLRPIYAIFAGEYARALRASGHDGLADRLARWGASVR